MSPHCPKTSETRCRRCNKPLTDPDSIKAGIGPVCARVEDDEKKRQLLERPYEPINDKQGDISGRV